jgi:RNA polymerase-binding protein DksA
MDLEHTKAELLAAKLEIESRMERTHKHIYQKEEPVSHNFSEQIKQTENDQLVRTLDAEGKDELLQIDRALKRVETGDYLQCSKCGEDIGEQRLLAIPYADLCIDCARKD